MTPASIENRLSLKELIVLTLVILMVILYFGLRTGHRAGVNLAERLPDRPGIAFGPGGIVHTRESFHATQLLDPNDTGMFSLEIALNPADMAENRFSFIFSLHNGNDASQLVVGQWRSKVVVMNGNDYAHRRSLPRVYANLAAEPHSPYLLTISSDSNGTVCYVNGKAAGRSEKLTLAVPAGERVQMVIANSVYGIHAWQGDVYGLALYSHTQQAEDAARRYAFWNENQRLPLDDALRPALFFGFDDDPTERGFASLTGSLNLDMPTKMKVLEPKFLTDSLFRFQPQQIDIKDLLVNFFGFIPFGLVLVLLNRKLGGSFERYAFFTAMAGCFTISLGIEIAQAWIPMRLSDAFDLLLNTGGGIVGALVGVVVVNFRQIVNGE